MSKKEEKNKKEKQQPKGRRGKRDYVGDDLDEGEEIIEKTGNEAEIEGGQKEPGIVDKLLRRDRKATVYPCPECPGVVYDKPNDLQKHLEVSHGVILIPEDIEELKQEIHIKELNQTLKTTKESLKETEEIQEIQDKRILNHLSKEQGHDPKTIISRLDANTPTDIFRQATDKMANTPDLSQPGGEGESYYYEEIKGESIEVSMIKRFPRTLETIEMLNKLKMLME